MTHPTPAQQIRQYFRMKPIYLPFVSRAKYERLEADYHQVCCELYKPKPTPEQCEKFLRDLNQQLKHLLERTA